jgi:hypothetical protein
LPDGIGRIACGNLSLAMEKMFFLPGYEDFFIFREPDWIRFKPIKGGIKRFT